MLLMLLLFLSILSPSPSLPPPPPPPDTCLAHENGETSPCKRGEKRIHRPQCGDLTVSPQTTVNTNYFWHLAKIPPIADPSRFSLRRVKRKCHHHFHLVSVGLHKEQVIECFRTHRLMIFLTRFLWRRNCSSCFPSLNATNEISRFN